jgi:hypothetical protein
MGSTKEILRNQYRSSIKETRDTKKKLLHSSTLEEKIYAFKHDIKMKKKLLHSSILEEKIYAFEHDIKTKNIGEIRIYHVDTSILTEENGKRKCIRHTTINNSSYLRYSYLVIIRNY